MIGLKRASTLTTVIRILCAAVFLLCLASLPVIGYLGGRQCSPLTVLVLPAEVVPLALMPLTFVVLVVTIVISLVRRRLPRWGLIGLVVVIAAACGFPACARRMPRFVHGLRDRFVAEVGYDQMRAFAAELVNDPSMTNSSGIMKDPRRYRDASPSERERWAQMVQRYPFLELSGTVVARDGVVRFLRGSALAGHWGSEIAPAGVVPDPDTDHGDFLRVTEDIQFVYYYD